MMELLLEEGIQVKDALLLAISEEYVEGVELLLQVSWYFSQNSLSICLFCSLRDFLPLCLSKVDNKDIFCPRYFKEPKFNFSLEIKTNMRKSHLLIYISVHKVNFFAVKLFTYK